MGQATNLFISHTTHDERDASLAHKLANALLGMGVKVWIAPDSVPPGDRWEPSIVSALLEECSHFLVILSASSVQAPWVLEEIKLAKSRSDSSPGLKILPLATGDLPNFEHHAFLAQFQQLSYRENFRQQLTEILQALSLPAPLPAHFRNLIKTHTDRFVGRENVFAAIQRFFSDSAAGKGYFTLVGDPGEGKTSILAQYVRLTGAPAHFNSTLAGVTTKEQFFEQIEPQLCGSFGIPRLPDHGQSFALRLSDLLEKAAEARPPGEPFVLVVDALDEAEREASSQATNVLHLPHVLPDGVFVLLSRRRENTQFSTHETHVVFDLIDHPFESRQDIDRYLEQRLQEEALQERVRESGRSPQEFATELADCSDNNFMYLHHVLNEMRQGSSSILEGQMPRGLRGYYEYHWRRMGMEERPAPALKFDILYLLSTLRTPISASILADICDAPPLEVSTVLDDWRGFLRQTDMDGEPGYLLYHLSFQDFLQEQNRLRVLDSSKIRRKFAAYYKDKLLVG